MLHHKDRNDLSTDFSPRFKVKNKPSNDIAYFILIKLFIKYYETLNLISKSIYFIFSDKKIIYTTLVTLKLIINEALRKSKQLNCF